MSEHEIQAAIVEWAKLLSKSEWRLNLLYAVPNGGKRNIVTARKMKEEGVKPGVPDLCLACAGRLGNALYLEIKTARNYPTPAQHAWMDLLRRAGNGVVIVRSLEDAVDAIATHLDRDDLRLS